MTSSKYCIINLLEPYDETFVGPENFAFSSFSALLKNYNIKFCEAVKDWVVQVSTSRAAVVNLDEECLFSSFLSVQFN
jgi:hypothetical protein